MASFASAVELGVDVIECDVHLTADKRLAVIHDHTLERTTNGKGPVGMRTLADLQQLDAGGGEKIPVLEDVLELASGRVGVAIEIKSLPVRYPGIERALLDTLRAAGMLDECAVISFDHRAVRAIKDLEPDLVCGVLVAGRPLLLAEMLSNSGAEVYSPHWSFVDEDTVEEVHACGAAIGVWTVDEGWVLERCRNLGVDSVYTNRPRQMLELLGRI
jgi:glycerophosphoryl diester phosphodiesterase